MPLYPDAVRDDRVREYLMPKKILLAENCQRCEKLLINKGVQIYLYHFNGKEDTAILAPGGMLIIDFGKELHGGVRINAYAEPGKIRLRFGESVSETVNQPNQDHAMHDTELDLPRNGMLEYGNTGFRFVSIVNTDSRELKLFSIHAVALYLDVERKGSFKSSDERLNKIWETAAYTVQLNMQDYIYDGIKRDRLVWMGDMHPEIRGILAAFGDVNIVPKSLDFMRRTTNPEWGMNSTWTYSMWYIISMADYFLATGNVEFLNSQKECVLGIMDHLLKFIREDGTECVEGTRFLDWPNRENEPVNHAGIQALMLWSFQSLEFMLPYYGMDTKAAVAAQIKLKMQHPECHGAKTPAALQTYTGLCDRTDVLETNPYKGVSTFFGFYVLLAKETNAALDLIRKYWGAMMDFGATTFWEDFDLDWTRNAYGIDQLPVEGKDDLHGDFGAWCYKGFRHSLCHGWSCGPMPFMSERLLGVKFLAPGGKKVSVTPCDGGLEYLKGTYPTPFGGITVEKTGDNKWRIDAPAEIEIVNQ